MDCSALEFFYTHEQFYFGLKNLWFAWLARKNSEFVVCCCCCCCCFCCCCCCCCCCWCCCCCLRKWDFVDKISMFIEMMILILIKTNKSKWENRLKIYFSFSLQFSWVVVVVVARVFNHANANWEKVSFCFELFLLFFFFCPKTRRPFCKWHPFFRLIAPRLLMQ